MAACAEVTVLAQHVPVNLRDRLALLRARARVAIWRRRRLLSAATLSALVLGVVLAFADSYLQRGERLGTLDFPISCGWSSQREFTRATALLHLFEFADAEDAYRSIIARDPDCAIAHWGVAMSRLQNPLYALPSAADIEVARGSLRAGAAAPTADPRERAFLGAAAMLFDVDSRRDWAAREVAYAQAMERVVADYPQDREAKIFYALALNIAAAAGKNAGDDRAKAAELLLGVAAEAPDHPGLDHYLTYCLGHARYQPPPFPKESPAMTPPQRLLSAGFAVLVLVGFGAFVAFTSDFRAGAGTGAIGGPFALTAGDGTLVTDRSFRGQWMLIYFGYTHCPSICPTTLSSVSDALDKLGPLVAKVQPLFMTLDPERDTPAAVAEFAKAFDPRIVGLSGTPGEIAAVAKEYRAFFKKVPGESADDYWIEHSSYIYVVDPDGRYATLIADSQDSDAIAARVRELLVPPQHSEAERRPGLTETNVTAYSGDC
jgi:protein SCO1/2